MSYQIKIENKYGDQLELTGNPNYKVKATGLSPVDSNIITASVANYGGERYVSSRQQKRNIVLTIYVCEPVEKNRINLYKYIRSHDWIRVYFKNGTRDVYIDGYVESVPIDLFDQTQTAQVSIICPQPNFIDVVSASVSNNDAIDNFYCPFNTEVQYSGGNELEFSGLESGVVQFTDFLATPEDSMGFLSDGACYTKLKLNDTEVLLSLGKQVDGINLIFGGESLISEYNDVITNLLSDESENVLMDENGKIIYE